MNTLKVTESHKYKYLIGKDPREFINCSKEAKLRRLDLNPGANRKWYIAASVYSYNYPGPNSDKAKTKKSPASEYLTVDHNSS